jgi:diguanylate cyclase (GGDEF)-like protein
VVSYLLQRNITIAKQEQIIEIALILVVLVVSAIVVFGSGYFFNKRYPIEYLILFPLIWASIRLHHGINLIFLAIVVVLAILGTASGYSQFSFEGDHRLSLIMLQIFIFTVTFSILMMTAQRCYTNRILEEKERLTLIDPLTQVGNRRFFTKIFQEELSKSQRYNRHLSLIIFDIDHFKKINDAMGHSAGDSVLEELSSLVTTQLRSSDHLARWGGEEFTIILPESGLSESMVTAEKLRKAIESYSFSIKQPVTCSFGVIQCDHYESIDRALSRVDDKLYEAKNTGRNKVIG